MTNTEIDDLTSELGEMIVVEMADFVQLFAETFEIAADAEAASKNAAAKVTCPRWHELREKSFIADPYKVLTAARNKGSATVIGEFGGAPVWLVTGYDDVRKVLTHPNVSNDFYDAPWWVNRTRDSSVDLPDEGHHTRNIPLAVEDERHARARPVLVKALNTPRVDALRPALERTAAQLLDALPAGKPVDLHAQYAVPLANAALAGALGIPADMSTEFSHWSDQLNFHMADPQAARDAAGKFYGFVGALMSVKRNALADDGLSDLWRACDEGALNEFEMHGLAALLLHAGQEATGAVTNSLVTLMRHPEQLAKLASNLSMLPGGIDEMLRYEGSLKVTLPRHTNGPIELKGITIPPRVYVVVSLAGADRDPAHFDHPDEVDTSRHASGHLAFGHGSRRCVGARLGAMVATIALSSLLARYPAVHLADPQQPIQWRPSTFIRRVEALPVVLTENAP
jgi:cytochrome P450 PksS